MTTPLSERFYDALQYAARLHSGQVRKGTRVPYIAHLLSVSALVLEDGGGEDEAIAGLLHDAVEDQGGEATLAEIRARYGERVAQIVLECSDSVTLPKPPWRARKEAYLAHLLQADPGVLRVSLADKIHNARDVLLVYRQVGEALWARFQGGRAGTLWYYNELVEIFSALRGDETSRELARVIAELNRITAQAKENGAGSLSV